MGKKVALPALRLAARVRRRGGREGAEGRLPAHVEEEEGGGGPHAPERREGPAACPARGGERNRREGKKERNRREREKIRLHLGSIAMCHPHHQNHPAKSPDGQM